MRCPSCSIEDSKVLDSRPVEDGRAIRRRRECNACGHRFTTYERIEAIPLLIIKKGGIREPFDASKLLSGLLKACEKRPVALSDLEKMVADIETKLRNSGDKEIQSSVIGEMVMEGLLELDEIAYVRFASVYRQFKDISKFMQELQSLLGEQPTDAAKKK